MSLAGGDSSASNSELRVHPESDPINPNDQGAINLAILMSLQKLNQNIESLQYPVELKHAEAYE
jgi:hypothetical protein